MLQAQRQCLSYACAGRPAALPFVQERADLSFHMTCSVTVLYLISDWFGGILGVEPRDWAHSQACALPLSCIPRLILVKDVIVHL